MGYSGAVPPLVGVTDGSNDAGMKRWLREAAPAAALAVLLCGAECSESGISRAPDDPTPEATPEPQRPCDDGTPGVVAGNVADLGHDPVLISGAHVYEWQCGEEPARTASNGVFEIHLKRADRPVVELSHYGYVDVVVGISGEDTDSGISIPLYLKADEIVFRHEDFGLPYDPYFGGLLVHLYTEADTAASELTGGAEAKIDLAHHSALALDETDEHVEGNVVPADSRSAEIWFMNVEPGMATIEVTPPPGAECTGPAELPVYSDTYTHANFYCRAAD